MYIIGVIFIFSCKKTIILQIKYDSYIPPTVVASCGETIHQIDIMNNKDKKIIIYGGTGHYGRKVVEKLIQKGKSVKVFHLWSVAHRPWIRNKVAHHRRLVFPPMQPQVKHSTSIIDIFIHVEFIMYKLFEFLYKRIIFV